MKTGDELRRWARAGFEAARRAADAKAKPKARSIKRPEVKKASRGQVDTCAVIARSDAAIQGPQAAKAPLGCFPR